MLQATTTTGREIASTPNSNFFATPNWDSAGSWLSLERVTRRLLRNASRRDPLEWAADYARNQPRFVQCSTRRDLSNRRSAPAEHAAIEVHTLAPATPRLWGLRPEQVAHGSYRRTPLYREIKEIGSRTPITGLFLAGTSTVWGPATEGAMLSGLHAAAAITGRDLQREIRDGAVLTDPARIPGWGEEFDPLAACRRLGGPSQTGEAEDHLSAAPLAIGGAR